MPIDFWLLAPGVHRQVRGWFREHHPGLPVTCMSYPDFDGLVIQCYGQSCKIPALRLCDLAESGRHDLIASEVRYMLERHFGEFGEFLPLIMLAAEAGQE